MLAQILYNNYKVKEHFRMKAWVCVSTEFHLLGVTKSILEATGGRPTSEGNLDLLRRKLKEALLTRNFCLFLTMSRLWNFLTRKPGIAYELCSWLQHREARLLLPVVITLLQKISIFRYEFGVLKFLY